MSRRTNGVIESTMAGIRVSRVSSMTTFQARNCRARPRAAVPAREAGHRMRTRPERRERARSGRARREELRKIRFVSPASIFSPPFLTLLFSAYRLLLRRLRRIRLALESRVTTRAGADQETLALKLNNGNEAAVAERGGFADRKRCGLLRRGGPTIARSMISRRRARKRRSPNHGALSASLHGSGSAGQPGRLPVHRCDMDSRRIPFRPIRQAHRHAFCATSNSLQAINSP